MKEKLSIKIDVTKIPKNKILPRSFQTKAGETVTVKELALDIVPLKETKLLKDGNTYQLWKTHLVAVQQTKEERDQKVKSLIIGEATMFVNKQPPADDAGPDSQAPVEEVDADSIPW